MRFFIEKILHDFNITLRFHLARVRGQIAVSEPCLMHEKWCKKIHYANFDQMNTLISIVMLPSSAAVGCATQHLTYMLDKAEVALDIF